MLYLDYKDILLRKGFKRVSKIDYENTHGIVFDWDNEHFYVDYSLQEIRDAEFRNIVNKLKGE